MATRTKMTPLARLLIFLIILVPLAYGGASYIRGEDPIANVKAMMNGEQPGNSAPAKKTYDPQAEIQRLKKENRELKARVQELEVELDAAQSEASTSTRQKWGQ